MSMLTAIVPLHRALDYHLERHNLLTSNLAHVDTPGYRPRELYRASDFGNVLGARLRVTQARHLGAVDEPAGWQVGIDRFSPVGPDGNGVSLDRVAVKIAANNLRYDALSTLIQSELNMIQLAVRDGR